MSRMLEALKVLERRQPGKHAEKPPSPPQAGWETAGNPPASPADSPLEIPADELDGLRPPLAKELQPSAPFETCTLPTATDVADYYLEMAGEIGDRLAPTYCNVVLFVGADRWVEPCFSMTHAAQAFTGVLRMVWSASKPSITLPNTV